MAEKINPFGRQIFPPLKTYSEELSKLKTALDMGCASGADSRYLASLGLEVDAIDKKLPEGIETDKKICFKQMDVSDFPFDKTYDVIVARNILQFLSLENRNVVMDKMYRVLNKGGYLFIISSTKEDQMIANGKFEEGELLAWAVKRMKVLMSFEGEKIVDNHNGSPGQHLHHMTMVVGKKTDG